MLHHMLPILRLHECLYLARVSDCESSVGDSCGWALPVRATDDAQRAADSDVVAADVAQGTINISKCTDETQGKVPTVSVEDIRRVGSDDE